MATELMLGEAPDTRVIEKERNVFINQADALIVKDDKGYDDAGLLLHDLKSIRSRIAEMFSEPVLLAHKAHKSLTTLRNNCDAPFKLADQITRRKMADHDATRRHEQAAEEARLRECARKEAEDRRLEEAQAAEDDGATDEEVEAVLDAPIVQVAPILSAPLPKAEGISSRDNWKHTVVAPHVLPREWMIPDEKKLAAHAKSCRDTVPVAGVHFYNDPTIAVR